MPIHGVSGSAIPEVSTGGADGELQNARFADDAALERVAGGDATLAPGASGPAVKKVQSALLDMGFALKTITVNGKTQVGVDGAYGNQTKNAVLNFQKHAAHFFPDVKPTGTVDAATLRALDSLAPAPGARAWSPGQPTRLPSPYYKGQLCRVVVVKDEHRTYLFDKSGKVQGIFADSVGKAGSKTNDGLKVVSRMEGEAGAKADGIRLWHNPGAFGPRKIDLKFTDGRVDGEQLHGTEDETKMGMDVSHGCMRHYNDDIVTMFNALSVGDKVAIVDSINDPSLGRQAAPQPKPSGWLPTS